MAEYPDHRYGDDPSQETPKIHETPTQKILKDVTLWCRLTLDL